MRWRRRGRCRRPRPGAGDCRTRPSPPWEPGRVPPPSGRRAGRRCAPPACPASVRPTTARSRRRRSPRWTMPRAPRRVPDRGRRARQLSLTVGRSHWKRSSAAGAPAGQSFDAELAEQGERESASARAGTAHPVEWVTAPRARPVADDDPGRPARRCGSATAARARRRGGPRRASQRATLRHRDCTSCPDVDQQPAERTTHQGAMAGTSADGVAGDEGGRHPAWTAPGAAVHRQREHAERRAVHVPAPNMAPAFTGQEGRRAVEQRVADALQCSNMRMQASPSPLWSVSSSAMQNVHAGQAGALGVRAEQVGERPAACPPVSPWLPRSRPAR